MDWGTKLPPWDLPELEHVSEPSISSVVTPAASGSGGPRRQTSALDFDLKLGGLGDFGSSSRWKEQSRPSTTPAVSPTGPSKRARTPSNGSQNVSCLVDGCKSDLSSCREYHRRHKVCEAHSKTPMVLVGGQEQRFCQQCSRFHLLEEFDEGKRSCRKRLDGHNRRRRKPQPEPINTGSIPLNLQGPGFSSYSHFCPTSTTDTTWSTVVKNEDTIYRLHPPHLVDRQLHFSGSYTRGYREGKQRFSFQQDNNAAISSGTLETSPACQPLLNTISFSGNNSNGGGKMFTNGLSQVLDSDCALSLLSSPTQASSINPSQMVTVDRIPVARPLGQGLQQYGGLGRYSRSQSSDNVSTAGFSCSGMDDGQVSTVLASHDTDSDIQCPGIFHLGGGASSTGHSNVLPFSW